MKVATIDALVLPTNPVERMRNEPVLTPLDSSIVPTGFVVLHDYRALLPWLEQRVCRRERLQQMSNMV